jgi:hypothetical protein
MSKKATPSTITQLLPKLSTCEDEEQQQEIGLLSQADAYAVALVVGGPLIDPMTAGAATETRLMEAINTLTNTEPPADHNVSEDVAQIVVERTHWAYRLGLMTGLRLARAVDAGGAR